MLRSEGRGAENGGPPARESRDAPSDGRARWSRPQAIGALQAILVAEGQLPSPESWDSGLRGYWAPTAAESRRLFGALEHALVAVGVAAPRGVGRRSSRSGGARGWTPDAVVEAIRVWTDRHGSPPTYPEWVSVDADDPSGRPVSTTVVRQFGSFASARVAAGVSAPDMQPVFGREEMLGQIRSLATALGRPPSRREWTSSHSGRCSEAARLAQLIREFGSWGAAVEAAGFARPSPARVGWRRHEIVAVLRERLADPAESATAERWSAMARSDPANVPSLDAIARSFGSWEGALAAIDTPTPERSRMARVGAEGGLAPNRQALRIRAAAP